MRGSIWRPLLITALVLVAVAALLDLAGLNPLSGVWDRYKEGVLSTQVVEIAGELTSPTATLITEEIPPTAIPTLTLTPQPTHTPTAIPLVEPQFVINGQVFIDLCEELKVREVEHDCPVVEKALVPLSGYFIGFSDYPNLGLYFEEDVLPFCPTGSECLDGLVIFDVESPIFHYSGTVGPGSASYLSERYILYYVSANSMEHIQRHFDFAATPGIDPGLMRDFDSLMPVWMYVSHDVMRTMAEMGITSTNYVYEIICDGALPGTPGCDD